MKRIEEIIPQKKKEEKPQLWINEEEAEILEENGLIDRSGSNIKRLLLGGLQKIRNEKAQLYEEALWVIERYQEILAKHEIIEKPSMKSRLMTALTKRKASRRLCSTCGKQIAIKHGLCADCIPDRKNIKETLRFLV